MNTNKRNPVLVVAMIVMVIVSMLLSACGNDNNNSLVGLADNTAKAGATAVGPQSTVACLEAAGNDVQKGARCLGIPDLTQTDADKITSCTSTLVGQGFDAEKALKACTLQVVNK